MYKAFAAGGSVRSGIVTAYFQSESDPASLVTAPVLSEATARERAVAFLRRAAGATAYFL
jgi:hypothetical protein